MSNIKTTADLANLALAAGFDLNVRGTKTQFARILGVPAYHVQDSMRDGKLTAGILAPACALAKAVADGTFTPAAGPAINIEALAAVADPEASLSDEELTAKTNKTFKYMMRYVKGAVERKLGRFNCVLVTGPGGIGKTFPIEQFLREYSANTPGAHVEAISGAVSAVKFVETLHNCQNPGDVVLLDDADSGLKNPDFLNVFKAATDPKSSRVVSWLKQNAKLAEAGVPEQFEFRGTVIVISNVDMKAAARKGANAGHVDAVLSRARHIDLGINSSRALALRVKYMIEEVEMFAQDFAMAGMGELHEVAKTEISNWIVDHKDDFRSLTLREACKVASCYIMCEGDDEWKEMAALELGSI